MVRLRLALLLKMVPHLVIVLLDSLHAVLLKVEILFMEDVLQVLLPNILLFRVRITLDIAFIVKMAKIL